MTQSSVLIISDTDSIYHANVIAMGLLNRGIVANTLREKLLSGDPINLKKMVDDVAAVIIVEGKMVLSDTITSALIDYAKSQYKVQPVRMSNADPGLVGAFNIAFHSEEILDFTESFDAEKFWTLLVIFARTKLAEIL